MSEGVEYTSGVESQTAARIRFAVVLVFVLSAIISQTVSAGNATDMPYKIVTFGTSLTARGGWQVPLQEALAKCLGRPVSVERVALSGATSDWAVEHVEDVIAARPDLVLVEFYVNDAALNRFISIRRSRENMGLVLGQIRKQLPHARIIVMAMNPIIGIRGLVRPFIDSYIDAHRLLASELGADFYDNRPAWATLSSASLSAAIPDGSHPLPEAASAIIVPGLSKEILTGECHR